MNGVRNNTADFFFNCPVCMHDEHIIRGQLGERSLVKTSCLESHVFHLECITGLLDKQNERGLDQRECVCGGPALPLIRMDGTKLPDDESPYCETRIFNACRTGNLHDLRTLPAEDEALVNRTNRSVTTSHPEHLLAVAIKHGHTDAGSVLIDHGANAAGHNGESPLHIAARRERTEDFDMLTGAGADINKVLCTAVREGNAPLLDYLLSTQPSQAALNNALHEAAEQGQTQCLIPLIKAGANDLNGALYFAVVAQNNEGRDVLMGEGADVVAALHIGAREGSMECLNQLINPTNINATNEEGETPLHITAANGHSKCLAKLLDMKADINTKSHENGWVALHLAASVGHTETVKTLLAADGIRVNEKDNFGRTALLLAIIKGHTETVKALLAADGIRVNEKDNDGDTALHFAAIKDNKETVKALLATDGIRINEKNDGGLTVFHLAAIKGDKETVKALLATGGIWINE